MLLCLNGSKSLHPASNDPVGNLPRAPKSVSVPNDFGIGRCHCNGEMPPLLNPCLKTYRASCLIVVPVHCRASIWTILSGVCKLPGDQDSKLSVLTAAAPLPALPRRPLVVRVATTHGGCALGTGTRHCECHTCRSNGMDER